MVVIALPNAVAERKLGPHVCPNLGLWSYVEDGPLSWTRWSLVHGSLTLRTKSAWLLHVITLGLFMPTTENQCRQLKHYEMMLEKKCHSYLGTTFCFCRDNAVS